MPPFFSTEAPNQPALQLYFLFNKCQEKLFFHVVAPFYHSTIPHVLRFPSSLSFSSLTSSFSSSSSSSPSSSSSSLLNLKRCCVKEWENMWRSGRRATCQPKARQRQRQHIWRGSLTLAHIAAAWVNGEGKMVEKGNRGTQRETKMKEIRLTGRVRVWRLEY